MPRRHAGGFAIHPGYAAFFKLSSTTFDHSSYKVFGWQYAKCYANMQTTGRFDKPVPTGPLTYEVSFDANCGCDTVLKNFQVAYDKTFKSQSTSKILSTDLYFPGKEDFVGMVKNQLQLTHEDYTATLLTCAMPTAPLLNFPSQPLLIGSSPELAAAPPSSLNLTAIDSQMVYNDASVGQDAANANANVFLFAEAAARASLKKKGYSLTDPAIYQSWTWYGELISQLQDLGFIVEGMTGEKVSQKTYSGNINIGEIMNAVVAIYLGAEALSEFKALGKLLASDPDDTSVTNFMNFWWNAASYTTSNSGYATGPLEMFNGMPTATLVYFQYSVTFTDWRSLFVSFHSESFDVYSTAIKLSLDMQIYNKIAADLLKALSGHIADHIKNTPIDFGALVR